MKIESQPNTFRLIIDDEERATFFNGVKMFYEIPKDFRPEINPYDFDDQTIQLAYKLLELGHYFPINKTPIELAEAIENAIKLAKFTDEYLKHVFGLFISAIKKSL